MRLKYYTLCFLLLSVLFISGGCGKKAPPFVPKKTLATLDFCCVSHVRYAAGNPPCEGSPISFSIMVGLGPRTPKLACISSIKKGILAAHVCEREVHSYQEKWSRQLCRSNVSKGTEE